MPGQRTYRRWTEGELALARRDYAAGILAPQTARTLGRNAESVRQMWARFRGDGLRFGSDHEGREIPERTVFPAEPAREADDILPLPHLDDLRPVVLEGPPPRRYATRANAGVTMIIGDLHFPHHDEATVSIFLETARQLKPARVILNGDLPDMLAVSKYPKDARPKHSWTLRDEAVAFHAFLRDLENVLSEDCDLVETEANHSGNGTGSRWWRYLSERVPHLLAMDGAEEKLGYVGWWYPAWTRLELVNDVILAGSLLVTHGEIARKWAGYSARAHGEKYVHSVLHSHTHRMGSGIQRVPAVGTRTESTIRTYEIGCACTLSPSYANAPNWTQGFAVVVDDGESYNVEMVPVIGGVATVATLRQTVRAA